MCWIDSFVSLYLVNLTKNMKIPFKKYGMFFINTVFFLVEGLRFALSLKNIARGAVTSLEFFVLIFCSIWMICYSYNSHNFLLFLPWETIILEICCTGSKSFTSKDLLNFFFNMQIFRGFSSTICISSTYNERIKKTLSGHV